jgi:arylsulfatase B
MLLAMDQSIGTIMHSLKSRDMLKNSIVIFVSDNGAAVAGFEGNYGSNWPLRGTKYSLWEGGIRVPAFIWSPLLKSHVNRELFHVTDWLPTLMSAIGAAERVAGVSPEYGVSQWESLSHGTPSPRRQLLHNIDPVWNVSSIRMGRFKLVQGLILKEWQGWFPPPLGRHPHHHDASFVSTHIQCEGRQSSDCAPDSTLCLFDIEKDPCERNNIADREPGLVRTMWQRVQELTGTASPTGREERDARSWPPMHGFAWSCWQDEAQAASE